MIYTIKKGDTLSAIAKRYNINLEELIRLNGLNRPNDLAIGQNIFLPTTTPTTVVVGRGDTLSKIADRLGVSLESLVRANPQITNPDYILIGQIINIPPQEKRSIEVNGYAIANISDSVFERTAPYLTYLSIFSYQAREDGGLSRLYEENLIASAREQKVAPNMVVTNIGSSGGFSSEIAHTILTNQEIQNALVSNIISIVSAKNYYGVDIDFEYVYPEERLAYIEFLKAIKEALTPLQKPLSVAVAPKYRDNQQGILYEGHDYRLIGEVADRVIIMTYEWGYLYGEPMAISPLREVESVLSYAITRIPSEKILMGMPNYAYDWRTPWQQGDVANTLTNTQALELAIDNGANIMFDTSAQAPYFYYKDDAGNRRVVWFDDARSIDARLDLVSKYNLGGVSYWTVNNFYPVNWSVLSSKFNITKFI